MSVIIFLVAAVVGVLCLILTFLGKGRIESFGKPKSKPLRRSWPAKQIIKEFRSLPPENRPDMDVEAIVESLDKKYGVREVNSHHKVFNGYNYEYTWRVCRRGEVIMLPEYYDIYDAIQGVKRDLKDREHKLMLNSIRYDLEKVAELTRMLRQEREIISEVTKQVTDS